jgi:hypothetical protein
MPEAAEIGKTTEYHLLLQGGIDRRHWCERWSVQFCGIIQDTVALAKQAGANRLIGNANPAIWESGGPAHHRISAEKAIFIGIMPIR